jgi:predicted CXXCH cytochrome family protein
VCHSRSTKIAEGWRPGQPLLDTHLPSLLEPDLFEADGKMLDEVYNYASFRQSKMFVAGVSCSDCHDPHSLALRADDNAVCEQCHDRRKYATASHHHHADASSATRCVACHMPARTYMVVDPRHDHAFRIPRPDESMRFGTSNACNDCHTDKDAAWAAVAVERWFGPERKGFQTWTEAFAAARADKVEANALLLKLTHSSDAPSIARATAFESLAEHPSRETVVAARRGLADADPLVRWAALRTLRPLPAEQAWLLARDLLTDPVRGVRIEAASLLLAMPQDHLSPTERNRLLGAINDYVTAQRLNADRPESRVNLGNLSAQQGRSSEAEGEYAAARALDPSFTPTYVGFAQLYAQQGRDGDGERALREALTRMPGDAELHLALGLNLVRQHRLVDALAEIALAAEADPGNARYAYVYAVALNSAGRTDDAIKTLEANHARHPADRDTLFALVTINRDVGREADALTWANRLAAIDPSAKALVDQLR